MCVCVGFGTGAGVGVGWGGGDGCATMLDAMIRWETAINSMGNRASTMGRCNIPLRLVACSI